MKKLLSKIATFFPICLLFACKTPPIQKTIDKIHKSEIIIPQSQLKIYFPQFSIFDEKIKKNRIAHGDGIIIILPDGKCMIIDSFDSEAEKEMVAFVKSLGITKIDYLIATHYHLDHIGGMPALINNFEIGKFYSNGVDFDSGICRKLLESLKNKNLEINVLKQGDTLLLSESQTPNACRIELLWPNLTEQDIHDAYYNPGRTEKLKNNTSLVFKFIYKDFSVMFTGDVYKDGDKAIVKKYGNSIKSTILKAPHHGEFYTANSPLFVKTVAADAAIIQDPSYMVNFIISAIYRRAKTQLLYRDTPGYILVTSDGNNYNISQESLN